MRGGGGLQRGHGSGGREWTREEAESKKVDTKRKKVDMEGEGVAIEGKGVDTEAKEVDTGGERGEGVVSGGYRE